MRPRIALVLLFAGCGDDVTTISDAGSGQDGAALDAGQDGATFDAGAALPELPATLSATGLYAEGVTGPIAGDVLSYSVRYPLWSDGSEKRRHLLLPAGGTIDTSDPDHWVFPEGTRLFKEFVVEGRPVETRLLWKTGPSRDEWQYVAYRFREDGSDADPVPAGEVDALGTDHDIPDTAACRDCHRGGGDFVLGVGALQLERSVFDDWVDRGVLPTDAPWEEPPGSDVERSALGYLHGNCGHCHGDVHPLATMRTMRLRLPVGVTDPWSAPAWTTTLDRTASHTIDGMNAIVVAGDPDASQLAIRMGRRDAYQMPPRGTEVVDPDGLAAIRAWILAAP
ncbi:MAG: hypothetical protein JJ863_07735 [Deltaproteobacteria bacterium]|nr:hypothetical protein [Deltaproteobacteria bacterium]